MQPSAPEALSARRDFGFPMPLGPFYGILVYITTKNFQVITPDEHRSPTDIGLLILG
jgi:hypothetical protein